MDSVMTYTHELLGISYEVQAKSEFGNWDISTLLAFQDVRLCGCKCLKCHEYKHVPFSKSNWRRLKHTCRCKSGHSFKVRVQKWVGLTADMKDNFIVTTTFCRWCGYIKEKVQ